MGWFGPFERALLVLVALSAALVAEARGAQSDVILLGLDALTPAAVQESSHWQEILNSTNVIYTLRATTTEHTRSVEAWQSILQGGYDYSVPKQKPIPYLSSRNVSCGVSRDTWKLMPPFHGKGSVWENISSAPTAWFLKHRPVSRFTFIYDGALDGAGHNEEFYSPPYWKQVEKAAQLVLNLSAAFPSSVIIVIADHGGDFGSHGYTFWRRNCYDGTENSIDDPRFRDVPFMIFGPEERIKEIMGQNSTGAACIPVIRTEFVMGIVSRALGIKPHPDWRPYVEPALQDCPAKNVSSRYWSRYYEDSGSSPLIPVSIFIVVAGSLVVICCCGGLCCFVWLRTKGIGGKRSQSDSDSSTSDDSSRSTSSTEDSCYESSLDGDVSESDDVSSAGESSAGSLDHSTDACARSFPTDEFLQCPLPRGELLLDYYPRSTKTDELSLKSGSAVGICKRLGRGWLLVTHNGRAGVVPASYVKELEHDV